MGHKPKQSMSVEKRAKQFAPFAAVHGLYEALQGMEEKRMEEERPELSEDQAALLNATLAELQEGERIHILFYDSVLFHTREIQGILQKFDRDHRHFQVNGEEIQICDLLDIHRF